MRRLVCNLALALALAALPNITGADSAGVDFDPPDYTPGSVNGQNNWSSTGSYDQAVVTNSGAPASFALQSLRISNAVTSPAFADQTFSPSLTNEAGETTATNGGFSGGVRQGRFTGSWSFISTTPALEQAGLSVVVSPDRGDGARMSWVQMEDTPSGISINFFDYQRSVGDFVFTNVASGLARNAPHLIEITMDFFDGAENDVVKVYVDGALLHTGTSWEDFFRDFEPGGTSRTVDSLLFRVGGDAAPDTLGKGFLIDNVMFASGEILVGPPTSIDQCKKGGWATFNNPVFRNQGECIRFVNR